MISDPHEPWNGELSSSKNTVTGKNSKLACFLDESNIEEWTTYLAKRARAKASLILQPPENSLGRRNKEKVSHFPCQVCMSSLQSQQWQHCFQGCGQIAQVPKFNLFPAPPQPQWKGASMFFASGSHLWGIFPHRTPKSCREGFNVASSQNLSVVLATFHLEQGKERASSKE